MIKNDNTCRSLNICKQILAELPLATAQQLQLDHRPHPPLLAHHHDHSLRQDRHHPCLNNAQSPALAVCRLLDIPGGKADACPPQVKWLLAVGQID